MPADEAGGLRDVTEPPREQARYAFLGARSCELQAMEILDRGLLGNRQPDPADSARTDGVFVVAV